MYGFDYMHLQRSQLLSIFIPLREGSPCVIMETETSTATRSDTKNVVVSFSKPVDPAVVRNECYLEVSTCRIFIEQLDFS